MGKGQSKTRTVSFDNEAAGIIDISEDVVSRLKRDMQKGENFDKFLWDSYYDWITIFWNNFFLNFLHMWKPERDVKNAVARETQHQPVNAAPVIHQAPMMYGATMTAMQVRKEKEAELMKNDQYWANRLKNQEAEFLKNSKIMEKEFSETVSWTWQCESDVTRISLQVSDVKKRFAQPSLASQLPPCQDLKSKIVECYRKNPTETLKCAEVVSNFLDCVNSSRIAAIDEKQNPAPSA